MTTWSEESKQVRLATEKKMYVCEKKEKVNSGVISTGNDKDLKTTKKQAVTGVREH